MGFWESAFNSVAKAKAMKKGRKLYEDYRNNGHCTGDIERDYNNEARKEAVRIARGKGDLYIASQIEQFVD